MTVAFATAFLIGLILTFGFNNPWLPLAAVVGYFLFGLFVPGTAKNSERFADSLYYLGLLLTLAALLKATIGNRVSEEIITSLGTGLSTTLVGLALRVIIIQFRDTVADQIDEAQVSLELETRNLVNALAGFSRELGDLEKRFSTQGDRLVTCITVNEDAIRRSLNTFSSLPDAVTTAVTPALEALSSRLNAVDIQPDLLTHKLDGALAPTLAAISAFGKNLEQAHQSIRNAIDLLNKEISSEAQALKSSLAVTIASADEALKKIAAIPEKADLTLTHILQGVRQKLEHVDLSDIAAGHRRVLAGIEEAASSLTQVSTLITTLSAAIAETSSSATEMNAGLSSISQHANAIAGTTTQIVQSGASAAQAAVSLRNFQEAIDRSRTVTEAATRDLAAVNSDVAQLRTDLAGVRTATAALIDLASAELRR